jgi:acyl-CoA thioesterase
MRRDGRVSEDSGVGDLGIDTQVEGGDGRYRASLSRDWEIWGPNGGYLAAVALRAAGAHSALHRPATFTCHFLGVAEFDDVDLSVRTVRGSRRAESISVSMTQHDRPILEALAWVIGDVDGLAHDAAPLPDVPDPESLPSVDERLEGRERGGYPVFWSNFDERPLQWIDDWEHRDPGAPVFQGWYRYRPTATFDDPFADAGRALLLVDTLMWPAAVQAYRPADMAYYAPSIDVSAQFHALAPTSEWLFCEARSPSARDGLIGGTSAVWSREGSLLATGGQQMLCRPFHLQGNG